ncbi:MAG TPA: TonB-dependent receptor plug domain-containing protein, partial [Blastocatellia bacterium]|nr:TonB-dependent receptor plug domain-containing protein [Blastocatellia bacterium]
MNIEVTSVSKKEEQLFQAAAAVYVITREDIRRSGLTSLPELFRLVPGMDVARIDGNKWAISVRGFNRRFVDKLLVLVDGRTVYSPHFSGVFWEAQQPPLEEIERIEVIRGPGGTLWGANAVNGVINIITKHAKDSQGGLMTAGGGSEEQGFASARYGGMIGAHAHYRAYARYFNRSGLVNAAGFNAHDWQNWVSGGWRVDWKRSERDALTVQAEIYDTGLRETQTTINLAAPFAPPALSPGELTGGNVLGRWDHLFSDRSNTTLQIYLNRLHRAVYDVTEHEDTLDVDFQHRLAVKRQEIVWGLGYRVTSDRLDD